MDIKKHRESLALLEAAAKSATGPLRKAVDAAVACARQAVEEAAEVQQGAEEMIERSREQFDIIDKAADAAIERAEVAENRLAGYMKSETKKSIQKAAETEKQAVLKSIAALGEQLKAATPLIATLMAARQYAKRCDNGVNIVADQRAYGHIECSFPNGDSTIVEKREHAMLLCEAWTRSYVNAVKMGPTVNVDVPEDPPATQANGAAATWPAPADQDNYGNRVLGRTGPLVVDDEDA